MDLVLVLPVILIGVVALWALIVKMINSKDRREDDDYPPTGGAVVTTLVVANATTMLVNAI
jgi:hypothetical protein